MGSLAMMVSGYYTVLTLWVVLGMVALPVVGSVVAAELMEDGLSAFTVFMGIASAGAMLAFATVWFGVALAWAKPDFRGDD